LLRVWWHARTYSLNMTISDISLKSSNMGTFCVWVTLDLLCCQVPKLGKWRIADPGHGIFSHLLISVQENDFMVEIQKKSQYMHPIICAKINILQFITCKQNIKSFAKYQTINKHSTFNRIHFHCYRKYQHFRQD